MAMKPDVDTGKMPYSGVVDCAVKIVKTEGPLGFFNGFTAYYGRCAPHAMIILLSIESITTTYRKIFYGE
jgi:solute carrier family 25 oxoglutarate transporter 11